MDTNNDHFYIDDLRYLFEILFIYIFFTIIFPTQKEVIVIVVIDNITRFKLENCRVKHFNSSYIIIIVNTQDPLGLY